MNPYWPYVPRRLILWPDFTNKVNAAERYVRPFSLPVFQKYLRLAAEEMEKGLKDYRRAALAAPLGKQPGAFREVLLAEQLQRMMRSEHALLEFEDLRLRIETKGGAGVERLAAILLPAATTYKALASCVAPHFSDWSRASSCQRRPAGGSSLALGQNVRGAGTERATAPASSGNRWGAGLSASQARGSMAKM